MPLKLNIVLRILGKEFPRKKNPFSHICWILKKNNKVNDFMSLFNEIFWRFQILLRKILSIIPEKNDKDLLLFSLTFIKLGLIFDLFVLPDDESEEDTPEKDEVKQWNLCMWFFRIDLWLIVQNLIDTIVSKNQNVRLLKWKDFDNSFEFQQAIDPFESKSFPRQFLQRVPQTELHCSVCGTLCKDGLHPNPIEPFSFKGTCSVCHPVSK